MENLLQAQFKIASRFIEKNAVSSNKSGYYYSFTIEEFEKHPTTFKVFEKLRYINFGTLLNNEVKFKNPYPNYYIDIPCVKILDNYVLLHEELKLYFHYLSEGVIENCIFNLDLKLILEMG